MGQYPTGGALNKDESGKVIGLKYDFSDVEAPKLKDVKCPVCGGDMVKTPFGYGCANYKKDDPESCRFSVGQIAGVKLKEAQVKELLTNGKTGVIEGFIAKTGMKFDAPLKLTKEGQITFDFPEKPKPVETTVKCPKCGELLKKSQWYYECDCGFRLGHTVAKVPLSEEIIKELLETGKTKEKVTGFTSKAGNVFDSCLKYEDERISFDFDNPGREPQQKQETEGQSEVQTAVQENGAQQMQQAEQGGTETQQAEQNAVQSNQSQRTDSEPDGADDFYAAMANEAAVFQEEEEQEWIAGSNFLDEFMP